MATDRQSLLLGDDQSSDGSDRDVRATNQPDALANGTSVSIDRSHLVSINDDNDLRQEVSVIHRQNRQPSKTSNEFEEEPPTFTNQLAALIIIVNVTIGAGLLAMPDAVQDAGIIPAMIVQVPFVIMIIVTCIMCTELTVKTKATSFHQVIEARCHRYVYYFTQGSLLLMSFGVLVAMVVIIGDQYLNFLRYVYTFPKRQDGTEYLPWYLSTRCILGLVSFFVIKPICVSKTVDFLKYASFLGIASIGFIGYVVASQFVKHHKEASYHIDVNVTGKSLSAALGVLPVYCLAYQCHLSWIPTAATMRKEEKHTTYRTISFAMILSAIIYSAVSVLAVLTFGVCTRQDITESFRDKDWIVLTTSIVVAIKCVVTLPAVFLPMRISVIEFFCYKSPWFANLKGHWQRILVTSIVIGSAYGIGVSIPGVKDVVNFIGCLAVAFIFPLPALAYLHLIDENRLEKQLLSGIDSDKPIYSTKDKFKRAISIFMILFGAVMFCLVLQHAYDGLKHQEPDTRCPNSTLLLREVFGNPKQNFVWLK